MAYTQDNFAVLLNPNARRVSGGVQAKIHEIVDPEHIYISESEDRAGEVVSEIVDRGYDTVFTGGGDGTVTQFINMLPGDVPDPRIGILKLGTGNAMAEIVSSGNPLIDLRTYTANPSRDSYELGLCEAEGTRFAFAGLGLDAAILNDYRRLKQRFDNGLLKPLVHNVAGYLIATFGMTIPQHVSRWLRGERTRVRITNLDSDAYAIRVGKHGGDVDRKIGRGEVIYEGTVNTVSFGTCPFYGYRLKMLPFAGVDPSYFHLRVSDVPITTLVANLPSIWNGSIAHPRMYDFHARRVHIEYETEQPYQLAGEAMGMRRELTVGMSDRSVDLVRFI